MRRAVALLAAALAARRRRRLRRGGAEPGAPNGATLVLDFTPNAAHSGIYAAQRQGFYRDAGVDLTIHQPGESTDAPKLLAAGRADFAILDIHDLGIAREQGLDLVGADADRPAPAGRGDRPRRRPGAAPARPRGPHGRGHRPALRRSGRRLRGQRRRRRPGRVHRVTIGFNAVSSLAAGKVDAATGFWNAEGVALRRQGVPIRVFKVNRYGAPPYPELVLDRLAQDDRRATRTWSTRWSPRRRRGYAFAVRAPGRGPRRPARRGPGARPRRPGGAAAGPAARPPPGPVRPGGAARLGRLGPRARPARTPARRRRGLQASAGLRQPTRAELAAARGHPRARRRPGRPRPPRPRRRVSTSTCE